MLYNQPLATRFGTDLLSHIDSGQWSSLDIAVAWVRRSGVDYLTPSLRKFLKTGKTLRIICGIDLYNTTYEGLQALLRLEASGDLETVIHHNEAGTIFHPKLYLFRGSQTAKLIVGSNNITASGLYRNTEAGLEVDLDLTAQTIISTINALDSWRDPSTNLARRLTASLLKDLYSNGYIKREKSLQKQLQKATHPKKLKTPLFAAKGVSTPPSPIKRKKKAQSGSQIKKKIPATPQKLKVKVKADQIGRVLLMRVRKAHVVDRPTQTQMPKAVASDAFFGGIKVVESAHDGQRHEVHEASARGAINTLKLEIPEMRKFSEPVIRFERTLTGIVYEAYDGKTAAGQLILRRLRDGFKTSPQRSQATLKNDLPHATWWMFI